MFSCSSFSFLYFCVPMLCCFFWKSYCILNCCGFVTFWYGSGSGTVDPYLWPTDPESDPAPDPDPANFFGALQDGNKKFFCLLLFEATFTSFFKDKKSQNSMNQGFSYYFCLMIEGSGSVPLTNGSGFGSGRPKNIRILRIQIRIRVRNTCVLEEQLLRKENGGDRVLRNIFSN